jgi:HK97 family phage portal protein
MAGFREFVVNFLGGTMVDSDGNPIGTVASQQELANLAYKELAISICINLIANAISQCTARTYEKGVEVMGQNHYILNVRPNANESSSILWHKAVEKMVYDGEALIVNVKGCLYVADSYITNEFPILGNSYESVTIGNLSLNKVFRQDEVILLRLSNTNIKRLIDSLYNSYEEMLELCIEKYRIDNQQKYVLELDNVKVGDRMFNDKFKEVMQGQLQDFLENQNAVLPLFKGQTLNDISKTGGTTSNDFQGLIENLFKTVAQAFNIPLNLLFGKTENITRDTKQFLVLTIEPIASMISEELSAKLYDGYNGFINKNYVRLDTSDIRHVDILEMANAVDKVLSSGILSINEIRETIGYNIIEEEYANKHWMTKNYSLAEDMLKPALPEAPKEELPEEVKDEEEQPSDDALEGGDNDEE